MLSRVMVDNLYVLRYSSSSQNRHEQETILHSPTTKTLPTKLAASRFQGGTAPFSHAIAGDYWMYNKVCMLRSTGEKGTI
jgi:hypothetical protein